MTHRSLRIRTIYPVVRRGASFILAAFLWTGTPAAASEVSVLWTQAEQIAAGDSFLAVGYPRGIALYDWNDASAPVMRERSAQPGLTGLWALGSSLYWAQSDSTIHGGHADASPLAAAWSRNAGGAVSAASVSEKFFAVVIDLALLRYWPREDTSSSGRTWQPPGGRSLAAVALRDSTAMVGGGDRLWLVRLRPDSAILLDSLALGAFVQKAAWAGDTLVGAFGPSGLKLVPTSGDTFGDSVFSFSDGGIYNELAVWTNGWAGLDLLGRVRLFARGGPLVPVASTETIGSLRSASARGSEIAALTLEFGIGILNAFTLQAPYWAPAMRLPGFVRGLEYSPLGILAHADFAGVFVLEGDSARRVMHNPYNALDIDVDGGLVVATGLLSGAALFELQTDTLAFPTGSVPISGFAAAAELAGGQLYAVSSAACDLGFGVYDVNDPSQPAVVTRWSTCAPVRDIEKVPGALAVALGDSGIWMYARPITDSTAPSAQSAERKAWRQLAWRGNRLYSRADDGTLARWQWDGLTLQEIDRTVIPNLKWFDIDGDRLALATNAAGVGRWRWTEGGLPAFEEQIPSLYLPGRVAIVADTLWFVDKDAVISAMLPPASDVREPDTPVRPDRFAFFPPYPNPFNGGLEIPLALRPGEWDVAIYNMLGQKVEAWRGWTPEARMTALRWNPLSKSGTSLAAGVYLIRAENAGVEVTRKVTFLK